MCQVRYCQNSNQSYPLQRQCCLPDGVDSVRGYNQPFVGLILGANVPPWDVAACHTHSHFTVSIFSCEV
ncbi:hypothetical protein WJX82_009434 [Trebouxia sp. C0006]